MITVGMITVEDHRFSEDLLRARSG